MEDGAVARVGTVLIVDDDESFRRACARGFADATVTGAGSHKDAIAVATEQTFDLAVIDWRLGSGDGLGIVRWLRANGHHCQIAIVSGYLSVAVADEAYRAGANAVMFKPVACRDIVRRAFGHTTNNGIDPLDTTPSLARVEWEHITRVLLDCDGNITAAARRLRLHRQSLQRKLRKYAPHE